MNQPAHEFQWTKHPEATAIVNQALTEAVHSSPWLAAFQANLLSATGTRLFDWLDRITVSSPPAELQKLGFLPLQIPSNLQTDPVIWRHSAAKLPDVLSASQLSPSAKRLVAIKVESIIDFWFPTN